jgi:hypothetical protein
MRCTHRKKRARSQDVPSLTKELEEVTADNLDTIGNTAQPSTQTEETDSGLDDLEAEGIDAIMDSASDKSTAYLSTLKFPEPVRAPC